MRYFVYLGFLLLLTIDTASNVLIKLAGDRIGSFEPTLDWLVKITREPFVLGVIGCYIAAFFTYTSVLRYAPVGPAYAAVHGHVVTVLIVSMVFLGERLTLEQLMGCGLIVAGIVVLAVTEKL